MNLADVVAGVLVGLALVLSVTLIVATVRWQRWERRQELVKRALRQELAELLYADAAAGKRTPWMGEACNVLHCWRTAEIPGLLQRHRDEREASR